MLWLRDAYFYLLTYARAFEGDPEMAKELHFAGGKGTEESPRCMFDRKMLMHGINTINAVLCVMDDKEWNTKDMSLQRFGTVPVEKKFGRTRLHAGVHQTMSGIIGTMERDEEMGLQDADFTAAKRQAYGEIVLAPRHDASMWDHEQNVFHDEAMAEAVAQCILSWVGFYEIDAEERTVLASGFDLAKYMGDLVGDHVIEKSTGTMSLYGTMMGIVPSGRTVMLSAKSETGRVVKKTDPLIEEWEDHFKLFLGRKGGKGRKIRKDELQWVIQGVEEEVGNQITYFEDTKKKVLASTRKELMHWVVTRTKDLREIFDRVLCAQSRPWDPD
jgi:hypothetical protein